METQKIYRKPVPKVGGDEAGASTPRQQPSHGALRVDMNTADALEKQVGMMDLKGGGSRMQRRGTSPAPSSAMTLAPRPAYTYDAVALRPSREEAPPLPRRPSERSNERSVERSVERLVKRPSVIGQFGPGFVSSPTTTTPATPTTTALSTAALTDETPDKLKEPSFWKTAVDETRFFAGGLIQKAYESTKHYTLVRHSGGLVMYRGPTTNVVVTLFSSPDRPVPSSPNDRTVWLQRRGYSGDTGLRLKTLVGASSSWLDVTPERQAEASELPTADERGYQRDIQKFMKKTVPGKHYEKAVAGRVPRETLFVRIPAACADGYFRLIVCGNANASRNANANGPLQKDGTQKKKVLCGSPVFRVASMSTDASIFRGASLSTLPVEAGVKIASLLGTRYVAGAAAPIVGTVQDKVAKYQPGTAAVAAAQTAYENSDLPTRVGVADQSYYESRSTAYHALHAETEHFVDSQEDVPPEVVGDDRGPSRPFPIQFQGRVVPGTGRSTAELGVPTANLVDVPDDVRFRLRGVYFGWAAVVPAKKSIEAGVAIPSDWIEAVVTVAPPRQPSKMSVVQRNEVTAHLLYDFGTVSLVDAKLNIILMAFLSPSTDVVSSASSSLVVASLSRPGWGPQATLARVESERSARTLPDKMSDKYVDTRGRVQKQVDRIPFHWAGVRTSGGEMRDQLYGNGGYWVPR
ncbi:riboflavin kinase [Ophiostoma piceae UAMH 11346]|uniref:Riboflavin kinase n=1 Tax=Ophiostoma piceae (strain UAMH 11346) TaxID=1262450 RepID=S3BXB5_OPHP1|nr:riboflavin kinase [Ophiostoma piceae UAMH 11346]